MSGRNFPGFFGPLFFFLISLVVPFSGPLQAADEVDAQAVVPDRSAAAESFVNERLAVWQPRLGLDGWHIAIIMSHPSDLKPKTLGNIHWDADKKSAVIRVLDASDYKLPYRAMLDDMEFTVVHELVHLVLSSLPRSDASRRDEEHAVNQLTDALLKLDRKNRQ
jgi:hypothetical protein